MWFQCFYPVTVEDVNSVPLTIEDDDAQTTCQVCNFVNFCSATKCAVCNSVFGTTKDAIESAVGCRLCLVDKVDGYVLGGCGHRFCRICILKFLKDIVENLKTEGKFKGICCPECETSLTRQDLRIIAGKAVVDFVDEWLCSRMAEASATYKTASCSIASWETRMDSVFVTLQDLKAVYQSGRSIKLHGSKKMMGMTKSKADAAVAQVLRRLSDGIKDICMESGGRVPYVATSLMCFESTTREVIADLLRNDSSLDIASRPALHFELFRLMRTMSWFPELFPMVCSNLSEPKYDSWNQKDNLFYHSASFMACLEKLHKQALFILQKQIQGAHDMDVALFGKAKSVFEQLHQQITLWRSHLATHAAWMNDGDEVFKCCQPVFGLNSVPAASNTAKSSEELAYISQLKPFQFAAAPLLGNHYYRYKSEGINNNDVSRSRRIAKEIAGFATHLPLDYRSSIHVRVDEVRMDVLRALIIGPENTPYENGIFLFDLFLRADYPRSPPKVRFLTTGGGRVRFHPNLYANGKVCLSLLGTWFGPGWRTNASTMLQVLISLQSLVFVDEPLYSEPGYEKPKNGGEYPPSKNYNHLQCFHTLMFSMVPALQNPDAAFKDVIAAHFRCKKKRIEEQCERWSKMVMTGPSKICINSKHAADEVKKELAKLV